MITRKLLKDARFLPLCAIVGLFAFSPAGVASAQDHDAVQKRLEEAVKNGELSQAQAKVMMAALYQSGSRENAPVEKAEALKKKSEISKKQPGPVKKKQKPEPATKKPHAADPKGGSSADLGAAWAKLSAMVDEGRITKKEAMAKMEALKKHSAPSKKGPPTGKKKPAGKDGAKNYPKEHHEAIARKLKAAVEAGELTPEQAKAKWGAMQKQAAAQKESKRK